MTIELLNKILKDNNIPEDVILMSDSGWECGPTSMNGIFYNEEEKIIIFRQSCSKYDAYHQKKGWKCLNKLECY